MEAQATKLGAQRLYNAVKSGESGLVAMYMLSINSSTVQGVNHRKIFDAWVEGGGDTGVLQVLLTYGPLQNFRTHRWDGQSNGSFCFGGAVLDNLSTLLKDQNKTTDMLLRAKEYIRIISSYTNFDYHIIEPLVKAIKADEEWPFPIVGVSRALAFQVACTIKYETKEQQERMLDWYLDLFGPLTIKSNSQGLKYTALEFFLVPSLFPLLLRLIPLKEDLKLLFTYYPLSNNLKSYFDGHDNYVQLKALIPWLDEMR